jgi:chromosome segregation ATPase
MENDKKAYVEESEQMLKRQGNLIEKLKAENKQYCKDTVKNSKDQKRVTDVNKTTNQCSSEIANLKDAIDNEIALHK